LRPAYKPARRPNLIYFCHPILTNFVSLAYDPFCIINQSSGATKMSTIASSVHVQPKASAAAGELPRLGGALWRALHEERAAYAAAGGFLKDVAAVAASAAPSLDLVERIARLPANSVHELGIKALALLYCRDGEPKEYLDDGSIFGRVLASIGGDLARAGADFTFEQAPVAESGFAREAKGNISDSPKTYKHICKGLVLDLAELRDLGAVMSTVLSGGMEDAPDASGYVLLSAKEARAILWTGLELDSKISALVDGFEADYEAVRKADFLARGETD
jgi:hypothetical protein